MEKKNTKETITVYHTQDIKDATHKAVLSCYGVVEIVKREETLRKDKRVKKGIVEEAIYVKKYVNRTFTVDVYLAFSNEVKITEALAEAQKTIMYLLNKQFNKRCAGVNVFGEKIVSAR